MTIQITIEEKKQITRDTMDRLLYCEGYKKELEKLNSKYNPHEKVNFTYESSKNDKKEYLFPLDKAI